MGADAGHNRPPRAVLELDEEMFAFLLANAEVNISFGLGALQELNMAGCSRETMEKMVHQIDQFKKLRAMLKEGCDG